MLIARLSYIITRPSVFVAVVRGWLMFKTMSRQMPGLSIHFNYWIYVWTNIAIKYDQIRKSDFMLYSVSENFDFEKLLALGQTPASIVKGARVKGDVKEALQQRYTNRALEHIVEKRLKLKT